MLFVTRLHFIHNDIVENKKRERKQRLNVENKKRERKQRLKVSKIAPVFMFSQ